MKGDSWSSQPKLQGRTTLKIIKNARSTKLFTKR